MYIRRSGEVKYNLEFRWQKESKTLSGQEDGFPGRENDVWKYLLVCFCFVFR